MSVHTLLLSAVCLTLLSIEHADGKITRQNIRQTTNPHYAAFSEKHKCPACLVLANVLSQRMAKDQRKVGTEAEKRKYILREDRVIDVLENSMQDASLRYTWIEMEKTVEGRYWLNADLLKNPDLPDETKEMVKDYERKGGDAGLKNYLRGEVLGQYEEALEDIIRANQYDTEYVAKKLCNDIAKLCTEEQVK
eukprot:PhF_6_TR4762/c0_g1_i1/m.6573